MENRRGCLFVVLFALVSSPGCSQQCNGDAGGIACLSGSRAASTSYCGSWHPW